MLNRIRKRLSYGNVVASLALFIALGGVGYAATASKNSVVSSSIKNGQVKSSDIANNAITSSKIKNGGVGNRDLGPKSVSSAKLSTALKTDLDDAATIGGLSVAQVVAAAGGLYSEARQAAGSVNVVTLTDQTLATLSLPTAGKYLITARMPVTCTYDGSDGTGATPDATTVLQPNLTAKAKLFVGATVVDTVTQTCEAEAGKLIFIVGVYYGSRTVEVTRQITTTGPTTVTLKGLADASFFLAEFPAAARVTGTAANSIVQAISVRTS